MAQQLAELPAFRSCSVSRWEVIIELKNCTVTLTVRKGDRISVAYKYITGKPTSAQIKEAESAVSMATGAALMRIFGFETTILP